MSSPQEITELLGRIAEGDSDGYHQLLPLIYDELHSLADRAMMRERPAHTLGATALVHEAYLRLLGQARLPWRSRAHFLAVAARAMREILIDHARHRRTKKRGGGARKISAANVAAPSGPSPIDLLALDGALSKLEKDEPRTARVVELRFFGGLTLDEVAEVLGVTTRTVTREWQYAQAWLRREVTGRDAPRQHGCRLDCRPRPEAGSW